MKSPFCFVHAFNALHKWFFPLICFTFPLSVSDSHTQKKNYFIFYLFFFLLLFTCSVFYPSYLSHSLSVALFLTVHKIIDRFRNMRAHENEKSIEIGRKSTTSKTIFIYYPIALMTNGFYFRVYSLTKTHVISYHSAHTHASRRHDDTTRFRHNTQYHLSLHFSTHLKKKNRFCILFMTFLPLDSIRFHNLNDSSKFTLSLFLGSHLRSLSAEQFD